MACNCIHAGEGLAVARGTSAAYGLTVINTETGAPYTLETGQVLVFAVATNRKEPLKSRLLAKKLTHTVDGEYYLEFAAEDTADLPIGDNYWYSIGIQHGDYILYPVIDWAPFAVTPFAVKLGDGA